MELQSQSQILGAMSSESEQVQTSEFKCPLCGKLLAGEEYYHAIEELRKKVAETYDGQAEKAKREFENKLRETRERHEKDIKDLKLGHEGQLKTIRTEVEEAYRKQLVELKESYDKINKESQRQFKVLKQKLETEHKKEMREKNDRITEMRKEQSRLKRLAFQEAKTTSEAKIKKLENDVLERDIQIKRLGTEIEGLQKQISQSQSELKGEAGEIDLYLTLTQAFPHDFFRRQKRGATSGDIIQRIRTAATTLDTPIVYDNKQAESITKRDIEKAKNYRKVHGTNYIIIVSSNLPKKDVRNELYGEREGILLVHPSIVVEVARQIRNAMIEIARQSESKKDREAKESKLYEYIRSQDFTNTVENLHNIYQKMTDLQDKEERAHARLWKDRKVLQSMISQTYTEISTGIDSIIQEKFPMQELTEKDTHEEQTEGFFNQLSKPPSS